MEDLRIYNSLTKKKEQFRPASSAGRSVSRQARRDEVDGSRQVGMYVCGITPYDVTHLGHAFTYTFFDVLAKYLTYLNYTVTYVQNVTDLDDDILQKAKQQKKNWRALGNENTNQFLQDMQWLGNAQPTYYVRATDHISDMQGIIKKLIQKEFAYVKNGNVYFEIRKDKHYGRLSKLSKKQMLSIGSTRGNNAQDPNKHDPLDFILWQSSKPGEPSWASPWGKGRPGWHIECSAMSSRYLGQPFAIHGGGGDLIFPHHESEITQSTNAYNIPFARYWMHTGMLRYQGEKMSKSLGNLVLIKNLKNEYDANTVRLALLLHQYRSVWECTHDDLRTAQKLHKTIQKVWLLKSGQGSRLNISKEEKEFFDALNDDVNTPKALKVLERFAIKMTRAHGMNITDAKAFLMQACHILGLQIEFDYT